MAKRGRPKKSEAEKSPITIAYQNALKTCDKGFKYILDNYDPLTREQEKTCSNTDLVLHNFRYMFRAFKKFLINIPISEYCSEIYAGLYDAAMRFDRKKNMKFITYAQSYVNLYLLNYARKMENIISFNPSAINKIKTIQKFIYNYIEEFNKKPSENIICKKFKLTKESYKKYMYYCNSFLVDSIDERVGKDKYNSNSQERTRADIISGEDVVDCDDKPFIFDIENKEIIDIIKNAITNFPPKQQQLFTALYVQGRTIKDAAKELKLTTNKANKMKDAMINSLKHIVTQ